MEPMTVSPGGVDSSPFLPSFLLGDMSPVPQSSLSSPLTPLRPPHFSRSQQSKVEGPPIVSLFDDLSTSPSKALTSPITVVDGVQPSELIDNRNKHWVLVFGFPPAQASHILAMFSQIGKIAETNMPSSGNWVSIRYANEMDVRKALKMNQKILSGNIMIGVSEKCHQVGGSPESPAGLNTSTLSTSTIGAKSPLSPRIRSLALSKRTNPNSPSTPVATPDNSFVGKVMDLVFGW